MLTTLRTGALTLASVQYKFDANKRLTIKLTTSDDHKLYGDVNIVLANVKDINVYDANGILVEDFFNNTFLFSRTGATTLEYSTAIKSGIAQSESFATLSNNGSDITATVENSSFELEAGTYNFLLLDTPDCEFSTSLVAIKQLNLGNSGIDGIPALYDKNGDPQSPYNSVNNMDVTCKFRAVVYINANSETTNIPLLIS